MRKIKKKTLTLSGNFRYDEFFRKTHARIMFWVGVACSPCPHPWSNYESAKLLLKITGQKFVFVAMCLPILWCFFDIDMHRRRASLAFWPTTPLLWRNPTRIVKIGNLSPPPLAVVGWAGLVTKTVTYFGLIFLLLKRAMPFVPMSPQVKYFEKVQVFS